MPAPSDGGPHLMTSAKDGLRTVRRALLDAGDRRRGVPVPPAAIRSKVPGNFRAAGRQCVQQMVSLGGLRPDDRVLELGCRGGRVAIPLMGYLSDRGSYDGVDDWPEGIAWCRQAISGRRPDFAFHDVARSTRPAGDPIARLPFLDSSFDFVVFGSILGLSPGDFSYYLAEACRLLRPGGTYFGTWFLLNPSRSDSTEPDRLLPPIACHEPAARRRLQQLGLEVRGVYRGDWDGFSPALGHQDVIIAPSPPRSSPACPLRHARPPDEGIRPGPRRSTPPAERARLPPTAN